MNKIFDMDSPLMRGLNKLADLMWLNVLTLVCCLPIVTAGAAITAAHYVELKMCRNEDGYITRDFFKSFKMNFKQSTIIGLFNILLAVIFITDIYLMRVDSPIQLPKVVKVLILAATLMYIFYVVWVFPVQAKFINTIRNTMKNAFAISMMKFPITILMVLFYACPLIIVWISDFYLLPIAVLFGISAPIYLSALLYNKFFKQLEENILANAAEEKEESGTDTDEDSEKIFSDEPSDEEEKR